MSVFNLFLKQIIFLTLLTMSCALVGQGHELERKTIVIDPGHGGVDSGAIGVNGILEKDVVLNIALEIVRLNSKLEDSHLDIYLTRYSDTLIALKDRVRLAKVLKADVFISVHCNQSRNMSARGVEVYVSKLNGQYQKQSILLAYEMEKHLVAKIGLKNRGVKFADFLVLRNTINDCPSVLLEFGFLSNEDEAEHLNKRGSILAIALLLLNGLETKKQKR